MKSSLLFLLTFFMLSSATYAQVTTAEISGVVYDDQNTTLPGANVTAVHLPTGTTYGTITNLDGRFNLPNLRVGGPYTITITYVGFTDYLLNDFSLTLGQTFNVRANLNTASNELDEVIISGTKSTVFNNDRTGSETSIGSRDLKTLPTISRSTADFTRLEPSASGNSFGGRNDQFNNFSLDGAIFNNPFGLDAATPGGQTDAQPISLDAIEQIQVSLAPYDVTQSGFTGATINAVTKSGTNEFTGTVYGFYRNEDLTGRKIKGEKLPKADLKQAQYGVSIGGPIIKNKLFFFANFEKDDRTDLGSSFVPNTGSGGVNESRVLESDLIAVQNALLGVGYNPGSYQGFTYDSKSTKGIFKLDWNIDNNNRVAVIYNFLDASKEKPAHPTAITRRGPSASTLQFQNSGYEMNNKLQSVQLEWNSTFSQNASNKLQAGYTHFDDFRNPFSTPISPINIQKDGSNYIIAGHEPFSINNKLDQKVFQISDNFNYYLGDHTFTVGASFEKFSFKNSFNLTAYDNFGTYATNGNYYGNFNPYPSVDVFLADAADPNGILASNIAYANSVYDASNAAGDGNDGGWKLAELNVGQLAFYFQDKWNVTENLKLTMGVRFDKPLYFNTDELIQKYIDTDNTATRDNSVEYYNPNSGDMVNLISTKMPSNKILFSPRLGFNYDVKGDKTIQLRGGTGIFTGRFPFVWLGNQVSGADDGYFQIVDPSFKWPQVWRTNLGTDYKFENGLILTGDVSYTKDINGAHVQNWGLLPPSETLEGVDNRPIYTAVDHLNNAYVFSNSDKGRIWNFTLKAQKTFGQGFYTSIAYNYLNAKDVNSIEAEITGDAFDFNPAIGNVNNDRLEYSKYGDTHRIIGVLSKQFNYGGDTWSTTISTFFEYAQGRRYNYTYGGDINGDGSSVNDLIYIPTTSEISKMQFSGPGQGAAFENFIQQDDYLSDHRGEYFERYGALAPWRGRWDMKILQNYNFNVSESKTNTIQFSLDVLNLGNLINSDWGLVQEPASAQPIGVSVDENNVPTYTFNPDLNDPLVYNTSLLSRWQAQIGIRYIF
ncbi:MAG: carboxypeptidase regulatory-like domain-containing protein [Leeuwenhoekiella sp.]